MTENFIREGWLRKKGFFGIFTDRYCCLLGSQLIVSKDEKREHVDLTLDITPNTKIQLCTSDKKPRFLVSPPDYKIEAIFEADSLDVVMNWVLLLRSITFTNPDLDMSCFDTIAVIGRGYYGKVRLVKSKETDELFAIKSIRKYKLIAQKKVYSVLRERNIMTKATHTFIVSLASSEVFEAAKQQLAANEEENYLECIDQMIPYAQKLNQKS